MMRTIAYLLQKEFTQIFRNRVMLPMIFIIPLVQLIVLVHAATMEMKDIDVVVVDQDLSDVSRRMIGQFTSSPFFRVHHFSHSLHTAEDYLQANRADMIIHVPQGFERELYREGRATVQLLLDAVNATTAGLTQAYAGNVIMDFNQRIVMETFGPPADGMAKPDLLSSYWYNPDLNYRIFMLPGILVILVTMIGMILSALNLVREKELGTAEQINVTPIRKYQFIVSKLVPFWIIGMLELAFGLILGRLMFDLPMVGSPGILFLFAAAFLIVALGMGLLISTVSRSQIQVMFLVFFFMVSFILMGGIFTPAESMPDWAIQVNRINPIAYFMKVIRMILLKGSGFSDISGDFLAMGIMGVIVMFLATLSYRKAA